MTQAAPKELIQSLLAGLADEISEVRSVRNSYTLGSGFRVPTASQRPVYHFPVPNAPRLQEESRGRLNVQGREVECTVISRRADGLDVATFVDLGEEISAATLTVDQSELLSVLDARLRALLAGDPAHAFNNELAASVFNPAMVPDFDDGRFVSPPEDLTDDQKEAVKQSLKKRVSFIWGPPGTGKTVTLAAAAWQLFRDNKRVLLVSHTNLAVDGVVDALCKRIVGKARVSLPEGCVLRLGAIARKQLQQVFGEQISVDAVAESQRRKIEERTVTLRKEREANASELEGVREQVGLADRQGVLEQEIRGLEEMYAQARSSESALKTVLRVLRIRYGSDGGGAQSIDSIKRSLSVARSELIDVASSLNGSSREELEHLVADLEKRDSDLSEAIEDLRSLGGDMANSVLSRARVIGCTASQALLRSRNLGEFDAIIIDEAAMLPLPFIFFLAGLATERVIIGGDFRQLPPISLSSTRSVKEWYARDIFEAAGIVDCVERGEDSPLVSILTTQFRGHEALCSLINDRFYGGRLVPKVVLPPGTKVDGVPDWLAQHNVILVDTADLAPRGFYHGKSKGNVGHALVVQQLCVSLKAAGLAKSAGDVGVIAPYRPQVSLIEDLIEEANLTTISVGTVHRFQGAERRTVIVDLTESEPHSPGAFLGARSIRETGARLLNVALSRAQVRLLLVANTAHIRTFLSGEHILAGIVEELSSRGAIVSASSLLPRAGQESQVSEQVSGRACAQVFEGSSIIAGLSADVSAANHSISFISHLVSPRAAHIFSTLLRPLIDRGVECSVVCGPAEGENDEAMRILSDAGICVECRSRVEQSAVIVDKEVLWLAGDGLLSTVDGLTGTAIRTISPSAAVLVESLFGKSLVAESPMPVAANSL